MQTYINKIITSTKRQSIAFYLGKNVQVIVQDLADVVGIQKAKEQFNKPTGTEVSQTERNSAAGTSSGVRGEGFVPQHLLDAFKEADEEEQQAEIGKCTHHTE